MTEQELQERGEIYEGLLKVESFKFLQKEMKEMIGIIEDTILENTNKGEDNLHEKGIRRGIEMVLEAPINAVTEQEKLFNQENS